MQMRSIFRQFKTRIELGEGTRFEGYLKTAVASHDALNRRHHPVIP